MFQIAMDALPSLPLVGEAVHASLGRLVEILSESRSSATLIALSGPPACGKTRIAKTALASLDYDVMSFAPGLTAGQMVGEASAFAASQNSVLYLMTSRGIRKKCILFDSSISETKTIKLIFDACKAISTTLVIVVCVAGSASLSGLGRRVAFRVSVPYPRPAETRAFLVDTMGIRGVSDDTLDRCILDAEGGVMRSIILLETSAWKCGHAPDSPANENMVGAVTRAYIGVAQGRMGFADVHHAISADTTLAALMAVECTTGRIADWDGLESTLAAACEAALFPGNQDEQMACLVYRCAMTARPSAPSSLKAPTLQMRFPRCYCIHAARTTAQRQCS